MPARGHRIYPYLLEGLSIERPNQVWAADVTTIPMARGFLYLVAIMDWHSRTALAWQLSSTLTADFCTEALEEAISRYGKPVIFNTDQGSQFTGETFITVLKEAEIRISMDGKGRRMDNVVVDRLWRSVKYEEVYLHAYDTAATALTRLHRSFCFYNERRTHQGLDRLTPDEVYFNTKRPRKAA